MAVTQNEILYQCVQTFTEQKAYTLVLHSNGSGIVCKLVSLKSDLKHHNDYKSY